MVNSYVTYKGLKCKHEPE